MDLSLLFFLSELLLVIVLFLGVAVLRSSQHMSGDRTGHTTDGDAFGSFIILVASNTADDRASDAAKNGIALRIRLGRH